jgi:hypothetical protein
MRRFFTKNLMLVVLGFVSFNMMAQINTLTINSPSGIAGNYLAVRAEFGSTSSTPVTADAVFIDDGSVTGTGGTINDGCQPAINSATGQIAFVDRGVCEFSIKALTAQTAGAVAVIVCNNFANATQAPFSMAVGSVGAMVTVPVYMISYNDCQTIRTNIISGGVNATLRFFCENTSDYGPEVIWGAGPDALGNRGDFNGGLNGWSIDNENTWEFDPSGEILGGAFGGTVMDSYSDCDGIMKFNSDFRDNGGVAADQGTGNGGCTAPCRGALISPNIDLSGQSIEGITIEFHQALRQFRSEYYLMTSKDNGVTWSDTIRFNQEYPVNSNTFNNIRTKIALQGFAGATQIRFKFEYVGNYYYWGIDDVVLYNEVIVDGKVEENWFAVAPTLRTPKSQVAPMPFMADISNIGNGDATDVVLEVAISDGTNEVVRLANPYGSLEAGETLENDIFDGLWTPPGQVAQYSGSYILSSSEEEDGPNNTLDFDFEVTDKTFGNLFSESQVTTPNYMRDVTGFWVVEPTNYYSVANIYHAPKGDGFVVENVRFGLANEFGEIDQSGFVVVDLYEWDNSDASNSSEPAERTLIGTNSILLDINAISNLRNVEIPLFKADSEGGPIPDTKVALKDNTNYLLVAHSEPLDGGVPRYEFLTYSGTSTSTFDRSIYSFPTAFALDSLELNRYTGSLFNIDGIEGTYADRISRVLTPLGNSTLLAFATAYLEMDIVESNSTYDIQSNIQVTTFPNPASNELYIDITLENVSNEVRVELVSIDGKVVANKTYNNVLDSRLKLDLSNVPAGAYSALIHTNEGVATKKVMVQK